MTVCADNKKGNKKKQNTSIKKNWETGKVVGKIWKRKFFSEIIFLNFISGYYFIFLYPGKSIKKYILFLFFDLLFYFHSEKYLKEKLHIDFANLDSLKLDICKIL